MLLSPSHQPLQRSGPRPRIALLASGNGSNFEAICDAQERGQLDIDICGLIYNVEDAFVATRAHRRGVPSTFVGHRVFGSREAFDTAVVDALLALGAEWVVMAGWMRIATDVLLEAFPDRILNLHPSLLPSFRGLHAVEQALEAGVKITGCTVHLVRAEVDGGPIIAQAAVPVEENDDVELLLARVHVAEHELYPRAIALALQTDRR